MQESLLPEAIRGSWYLLADDDKPIGEAIEKKGQLLALRLSGTFCCYDLAREDGGIAKVEKDSGDYTFDGDFLILRGRNTETYRVRIGKDWRWSLETKKKRSKLVRGQMTASDFFELDAHERAEIATLAHRVQVETPFSDSDDAIFELVYSPSSERRLRLGYFSVDLDAANGELWLGLTPLVTNLSADTWQKIIAHACAMMVRINPARIDRILLDIAGHAVRVINVAT